MIDQGIDKKKEKNEKRKKNCYCFTFNIAFTRIFLYIIT